MNKVLFKAIIVIGMIMETVAISAIPVINDKPRMPLDTVQELRYNKFPGYVNPTISEAMKTKRMEPKWESRDWDDRDDRGYPRRYSEVYCDLYLVFDIMSDAEYKYYPWWIFEILEVGSKLGQWSRSNDVYFIGMTLHISYLFNIPQDEPGSLVCSADDIIKTSLTASISFTDSTQEYYTEIYMSDIPLDFDEFIEFIYGPQDPSR
jgi:hypothetical protein